MVPRGLGLEAWVVGGGGGDDPRTNHRYSLHRQPLLEQERVRSTQRGKKW